MTTETKWAIGGSIAGIILGTLVASTVTYAPSARIWDVYLIFIGAFATLGACCGSIVSYFRSGRGKKLD